jgi:hypothetical protein
LDLVLGAFQEPSIVSLMGVLRSDVLPAPEVADQRLNVRRLRHHESHEEAVESGVRTEVVTAVLTRREGDATLEHPL